MGSKKPPELRWLDEVEEHDYDAALAYLTLRLDTRRAKDAVAKFRYGNVQRRRANDILRAAGATAAPLDDPGVLHALSKLAAGQRLSPVLVLSLREGAEIADGYHRVSLAYRLDPFADVPLRLAYEVG